MEKKKKHVAGQTNNTCSSSYEVTKLFLLKDYINFPKYKTKIKKQRSRRRYIISQTYATKMTTRSLDS